MNSQLCSPTGRNTLAALNAGGFEGMLCIVQKLHLVVCDASGPGNTIRFDWNADIWETQALLEKCHQVVGHFSHNQLHESRGVASPSRLRDSSKSSGASNASA